MFGAIWLQMRPDLGFLESDTNQDNAGLPEFGSSVLLLDTR